MNKCDNKCGCKFHRYYEGCNKEVMSLFLETSITGTTISYKVINKGTCMYFGLISICSSLLGTITKKVTLEVNDSITVTGDVAKALYYEGKNKNDISIAFLKVKKGTYVFSNEVETYTINNTLEDSESQPGPAPNIPSGPVPGTWIYSIKYANHWDAAGIDFYSFINSPMSTSDATNVTFTILTPTDSNGFEPMYSTISDYSVSGNVITVNIPLLRIGEMQIIGFSVTDTPKTDRKYIVHIKSDTPLEWQPRATAIEKL